MRKIETALLGAIAADTAFQSGNTRYEPALPGHHGGRVLLHGHGIAERLLPGGRLTWKFTLAGWPTVTTRRRINCITNAVLGYPVVRQLDKEQLRRNYRNDEGDVLWTGVNADEWFSY